MVHSLTKFMTGNGSAIGGVICDTGRYDWSSHPDDQIRAAAKRYGKQMAFLGASRRVLNNVGGSASPFDAYLQLLGTETLQLRMERHCGNAAALVEFLSSHRAVETAEYPGAESSRWRKTVDRQFGGRGGALLTCRLGTRERCFAVLNRLRMARRLANLGDAKTLVIHPASTIYRDLDDRDREAAGVYDDLIRISRWGVINGGIDEPE